MNDRAIVLFDGVCNLCDASVQFVIRRDPRGIFQFASLQGNVGSELARGSGVDPSALDSIVLLDHGKVYRKSSAALRIAKRLNAAWPLMYVFIVVPAPVRDLVYDFVGNRRYRWFGRKDQCWVPDADLRSRFLDQ